MTAALREMGGRGLDWQTGKVCQSSVTVHDGGTCRLGCAATGREEVILLQFHVFRYLKPGLGLLDVVVDRRYQGLYQGIDGQR